MNNFRQKIKNTTRLVKNKTGRNELFLRIQHQSWPFLGKLAFFYRRIFIRKVKIIVVIGSLGKTSTTRAIKIALGLPYTNKYISNQFGALAFSLLKISPFSKIHAFEVALAEPGDIESIGKIVLPDIVVFTSVATDHLFSFKTLENIRDEKAKMIRHIRKNGILIANEDDDRVMWAAKKSGSKFISYGLKSQNPIKCNVHSTSIEQGLQVSFEIEEVGYDCHFKLYNSKMIYPVLAALNVGMFLKFKVQNLISNLEKMSAAPGRMQVEKLPNGTLLLGDYIKSTSDSVKPALEMVKEQNYNQLIVIYGTMNFRSLEKGKKTLNKLCFEIGRQIAEVATKAIFISEMEEEYFNGAISNGMNRQNIVLTNNSWKKALQSVPENLGEKSLIYISGLNPQKLERIYLALKGKKVHCNITTCDFSTYCIDCSEL